MVKLTPALERIIAGFTEKRHVSESGEILSVGVLDDDAQAAVVEAGSLLEQYIDGREQRLTD